MSYFLNSFVENLKIKSMKLLFYFTLVLSILTNCQTNKKKTQKNKIKQSEKQIIDKQAIIGKVRTRNISDSLTIAEALHILAEKDGQVVWQLFKPAEFINDPNIIGVKGSTLNNGVSVPYKVWYLYQLDNGKITFHGGEMAGREIQEIQFAIYVDQMKMFDEFLENEK